VPPSTPVVEARGIRKSYGSRLVLDAVSLSVGAGEVVGLLGPNGAGKTTTLSILATLLEADAGDVRIAGVDARTDPEGVRRNLGFVPQSIALYPTLNAHQNLELFARLHGIGDVRGACARALDDAGLADRARDPVAVLSGGMKRRLNLACGLVHRPGILLLDEPTVGVDPQSRENIFVTIKAAARAGAAVIYSTHYMEEAERLCGRVLLIDHGRVVADGTVAELIALAGGWPRLELTLEEPIASGWHADLAGVTPLPTTGAELARFRLASLEQVSSVLERARAAGGRVLEFSVHSPNLSDAFIALTGHALRDPGSEPQ
jgi:linearmycin/streptolysin S transport system ATP-binding protein